MVQQVQGSTKIIHREKVQKNRKKKESATLLKVQRKKVAEEVIRQWEKKKNED